MTTEWELDGNPGLVLMHMQNGIFDAIPWLRELPMIENQQRLVAAFRERDLPVFFSSAIPNPFGKLPAYGRLMQIIKEGVSETAMLDDLAHVQQYTEPIPELERRPDEPICRNWLLGAFTGSGLEIALRQRNVQTIVMCGYAINSTVYNSAVQATDLWFSTVIPRDACATTGRLFWPDASEEELAAKDAMIEEVMYDVVAGHIAAISDVDDVIAHLG